MDTLRSRVIRLAHTNPELRPTLLPLVTRTAAFNKLQEEKLDNLKYYLQEFLRSIGDSDLDTKEEAVWKAAETLSKAIKSL